LRKLRGYMAWWRKNKIKKKFSTWRLNSDKKMQELSEENAKKTFQWKCEKKLWITVRKINSSKTIHPLKVSKLFAFYEILKPLNLYSFKTFEQKTKMNTDF
jgi:hypothetical protein